MHIIVYGTYRQRPAVKKGPILNLLILYLVFWLKHSNTASSYLKFLGIVVVI